MPVIYVQESLLFLTRVPGESVSAFLHREISPIISRAAPDSSSYGQMLLSAYLASIQVVHVPRSPAINHLLVDYLLSLITWPLSCSHSRSLSFAHSLPPICWTKLWMKLPTFFDKMA